ncbi:subtilase family protein [Lachnotalea glycerini]|uniref:Subtilase family protein n=1 Tax=Lachnotalea glycerini TaxID=1763509 RepID=A0A318ELW6_9FIRM|nr:S8 family peptidase [Lachnotalea glycerini]PXV89075.1 subtilase family protein [Lachnotalea glycerini]
MANEIVSEDYIDLIIDNESLPLFDDASFTYITFVNSVVHLPKSSINKCSLGKYPFSIFPTLYTLESTISLEKSGIQQIQLNPNFNLYGHGVLIGIVDTGIDYQHEAFLGRDGTTKIVSIWDQTINNGASPPEGFPFGTEYKKEQIDAALKSPDPLSIVPSKDEIGHGTMLAGIIAGTPKVSADFSGVVPDAEIVVTKLKPAKLINKQILSVAADKLCYEESDIIFGINYLMSVAKSLNRPLAICIAMGTNQSGHDGYGTFSRFLNYATRLSNTSVSISAGNEGNTKRHYFGTTKTTNEVTEFEVNVGKDDKEFFIDLWQEVPYRVTIDIRSPTGEYIAPIYPSLNECIELNFIFEPTKLWVNNLIFDVESGDQLIFLRFENAQEGVWKFGIRNIENISSNFHVWLPSGDLITNETYFLNSNPDTTITSPANAPDPTAVTAYDPVTEGIAIFSSRGYTRVGLVKPDMAAPGVNLTCPTLNNSYGSVSGTGAAAAHTTGIMAMVFEWAIVEDNFTPINGFIIKELLIRGAKRYPNQTYPNNVWGYGKIDVYGLFKMLIV